MMIDPGHPRLSIVRQCELASISLLALAGIGRWIVYYNAARPLSSFVGRMPDEGLYYPTHDGETGGVNTTRSTLAQPPNCLAKRTHLSDDRPLLGATDLENDVGGSTEEDRSFPTWNPLFVGPG